MNCNDMAADWAASQARSEAEAFELAMTQIRKPVPHEKSTILLKAAETIQRLGAAAQDCRSCARLSLCNAYQTENRFENCDYKWIYAEEVQG